MNKTFKVIFSKTRGALVAVNEAAKTTSRASVKTAVAGVCAALLSVPAMAEGFTDYCKDGNCVVDGQTVKGDGSVVLLDNRDTAKDKVQSITIKNSTISNTRLELHGSQKISVSDTVFTGLVSGQPRGFGIYAHNDRQRKLGELDIFKQIAYLETQVDVLTKIILDNDLVKDKLLAKILRETQHIGLCDSVNPEKIRTRLAYKRKARVADQVC